MAKYDVGDEVRLKKKISFNTTHVRPNTIGEVKKVTGGWGSKKYHVRWRGVSFDIQMDANALEPLTAGEGW